MVTRFFCGDTLQEMAELEESQFDAVEPDPPAELLEAVTFSGPEYKPTICAAHGEEDCTRCMPKIKETSDDKRYEKLRMEVAQAWALAEYALENETWRNNTPAAWREIRAVLDKAVR